jgi:hypothetical protein
VALALFVPDSSIAWVVLTEGRLLFASVPMNLPVRPDSVRVASEFFVLDPSRTNTSPARIEVKEGSLPDDLGAFALSPDGRFVAVVEGGTDAVAPLELATGKAPIISPAHNGWKSRILPNWKSPDELIFAALPSPGASRPELMMWQQKPAHRCSAKIGPMAM